MKRKTAVLVVVFALYASLVFGVQTNDMVRANPINTHLIPSIEIGFPNTSIGGYVNSTVGFRIYVYMPIESPTLNSMTYTLDGGASTNIQDLKITKNHDDGDSIDYKTYTADITLTGLSEGTHSLVAYAGNMSDSTEFIVNSFYHVTALYVVSPNNPIYFKTVPVAFTFTGEMTNAHYYLYNGQKKVSENPLSGNITLDNLPDGSYTLYLFVTTQYGQDSKQVHFYVIGNYTLTIATIALALLAISICVLVYFKKFRPKSVVTTAQPASNAPQTLTQKSNL